MPVSFLSGCSDLPDFYNNDPGTAQNSKTSFEIRFSKPMDTASVEEALSMFPEAPVFFANSPVWSENDMVAHFECDFAVTGSYTLVIAASAKDKTGKYLDGNSDGAGGDEYNWIMVF